MATSIANPQIPLLAPIPGGFMHGKIIRIRGSLSPSAQRFAINLQCGPNTNPRDDLALHLNIRIHERAVVRNSLIGGHWGQEERHGSVFPFVPGQGFEILLLAEVNNYKIAINGQHFTDFRCRAPMERVSYLSADGEIMISAINFEGGTQGVPGMHAPMPVPMPMPMPGMPQHGHQAYPAPGMAQQPYPVPGTYPTQPGMGYPAQPGMGYAPQPGMGYAPQPGMGYPTQPGMGYPTQPGMHPAHYGHLSPKSAPYSDPYAPNPDPYAPYPNHSNPGVSAGSAGSGTGLTGLINKASTAVAGLGLASGVTGLLGSLTGGGGHRSGGYPAAGYPGQSGFMNHGGGSGGGGLLGGLGTAMGAAALGTALLNPKKAAKKQAKAQKKALKYGIPLAAVGVGAYGLHHGMKHHGYHGRSSSSSSSSSE